MGFTIRTVADIRQIETQPISHYLDVDNTYDMLKQGLLKNPDAIAMSYLPSGDQYQQPVQISYRAFGYQIHQCANLFHSLGVTENAVVSYLLPNIPQTHVVLWGAEIAGVVNPINPLLEADTIKGICRAAKTKVLVALGSGEIWQKVLKIKDDIPSLTHVLCLSETEPEQDNVLNFNQQLSTQAGNQLNFSRKIQADDIASLYHTGGTTGTPKLARRTHYNEVTMAWMICAMSNMHQHTTLLSGLPLFHVNATTITGLSPFSMGAHVVILSPLGFRDVTIIKHFYNIVEHYQANFFSSVPTVLSALLEVPVGQCNIDSLEYAICGAAPLSIELFKRFEQHTGMKILEGYGLTECACASSVNPKDGERKVGSIGLTIPFQRMKVALLDSQTNQFQREAEIDEIGSILIKGPNVFKGYVDEAHNKHNWVDGWFNTGDLGRVDANGYYWLTGRKKELIIRGGHNIDPLMIEEVFYQLSEVKVVAAIACPHPKVGEVPVVYVQLVKDSVLTTQDLMQYAQQHMGEQAAIPKSIKIIDTIPLTPVGKIFKPALRWDVTRQTYEAALAPLNDKVRDLLITVGEDKVYGTRVDIELRTDLNEADIKAVISDILAAYSLYYQLTIMK